MKKLIPAVGVLAVLTVVCGAGVVLLEIGLRLKLAVRGPASAESQNRDLSRDVPEAPPFDFNPYTIVYSKPNVRTANYVTNSLGFRNEKELEVPKPVGRKRVFIIGGSQGIGFNASSNATTPAGFLEVFLREKHPDLDIEVVNAACSGFNSSQELVLLAKDVLRYEPDLIVEIGGGSDMVVAMLPQWRPGWNELYDATDSMITHPFWEHSKALTLLHRFLPAPPQVRQSPAVFRPEVARIYGLNVESMMWLTSPRNIPFIAVLHPILLASSKPLAEEEKKLIQAVRESKVLAEGYEDVLKRHYKLASENLARLKPPKHSFVMDSTDMFAGVSERVFSDRSHLNDTGYRLLAESIGRKIESERLLGSAVSDRKKSKPRS